MTIAAVQYAYEKGNIRRNLDKHTAAIDLAIALQTDLICFPELSLTGYEPSLAKSLATTAEDPRWQALQERSNTGNITIIAGVPLIGAAGIHIGSLIFQPHKTIATYAKQWLHDDEKPWFVPGTKALTLTSGREHITPAICYESLQPEHAAQAGAAQTSLYLAMVAKSEKGVQKAFHHYPSVAREYGFDVVMANAVGPSDDFINAGSTAAWSRYGDLILALDRSTEAILRYDTQSKKAYIHT